MSVEKKVNTLSEISAVQISDSLNFFVYDKDSNSGYGMPMINLVDKIKSETDTSATDESIEDILSKIGNLESLTTVAKSDLVSAIKEIVTDIGGLNQLSTASKTALVNAINEINNKIGTINNLKTSNTTNTVAAINELNDNIGDISKLAGSDVTTVLTNLSNKLATINAAVESAGSSSSSSASTPVASSSVSFGGNGCVYYANNYITNKSDCTSELQKLVNNVYSAGGGVIKFDKGDYYLHSLTLMPKVSLEGEGRGLTRLHRLSGNSLAPSTIQYANQRNSNFQSNKAFILIPMYTAGLTIRNLSFVGVFEIALKSNNDFDGFFNDKEVVDGLKFEDFVYGSGSNDIYWGSGDVKTSENPKGGVNNYRSIMEETKLTTTAHVTYKNILVENVFVVGFSGHGIYVGSGNYAVTFRDFGSIWNFMNGIQNNSTDNFFSGGYVEHNCRYGIYDLGGNCKFSDMKVIWNGECKHDAYGIYCSSTRNCYTNVEVQDNFCNGIYVGGRDNIISNITSDCNGYRRGYNINRVWQDGVNNDTPQDATLVYITGQRNHVDALCTQYTTSKVDSTTKQAGPVAGYALRIQSAQGCVIHVTEDSKIKNADYGCSKNGSTYNGSKLTSSPNIQAKDNNSIIYIAVNTK